MKVVKSHFLFCYVGQIHEICKKTLGLWPSFHDFASGTFLLISLFINEVKLHQLRTGL